MLGGSQYPKGGRAAYAVAMRRYISLAILAAFVAACGGVAPSGDVPSGDAAAVADGSEVGAVSCLSMLGNA